jgi:hypothetical protein
MAADALYLDLLSFAAAKKPTARLETRMMQFLEREPSTESLDAPAFAQINGARLKADYLLGGRGLVAELKTLNGDPHDRLEQRLRDRFAQSDAPIGLHSQPSLDVRFGSAFI